MTYRDEQEALRSKNHALERALDEAREENEQLRARLDEQSSRGADRGADHAPIRPAFVVGLMLCMLAALVVARAAGLRAAGGCPRYGYASSGCPRWSGLSLPPPAPYGELERFSGVFERGATVSAVRGHAPVEVGTTCSVRVLPTTHPRYNCRIELECGGETLYGEPRAGYTQCALDHGMPVSAHDLGGSARDGDPRLDLDLALDRAVVSDDLPEPGYAFDLALDPAL